jgi:hypothetical protein
VTIVAIIFLVTVVAVVILLASVRDLTVDYVIGLYAMIAVLLFAVLLILVSGGLMVTSTIILVRMEKPKDVKQFGFYVFKRKLGRSIILFNILMIPAIFFSITSAIEFPWPDFWTFYTTLIVQIPAVLIILVGFSCLTAFTLIHEENLKIFYGFTKITQ